MAMSSELEDTLKKRLDENYTAFIDSLQKKTVPELIAIAPEITAVQQLHEELLDACDDEDAEFLLRFDDPLKVVRGYWESEIAGYDHSSEMGRTLWRIREDHQDEFEQQEVKPFGRDEIALDPVMDFSKREIAASIEIGFDVGRRFQVYPNIDDTCDLYAKYDPVSKTFRAELCINSYDGETQWNEQWEPVELLPSEREMIIGLMEDACQSKMGRSLRDAWMDHHQAINKERAAHFLKEAGHSPVTPDDPPKPKIQLAYPGEDVYSVLHRAIKTLKEAGQQQEAAAMAFLVFSAKNPKDALAVLSDYVKIEPPYSPKAKTDQERGKTHMSDNIIKQITVDDLRHMGAQEGLILQGCGGDPQEWADGINQMLTDAGILLDGTRFENVVSFQHEGLINLLFPFEDAKVDAGRLAMWRLQTHEQFGGMWLSDYVPNRLGGFVQEQRPQRPRMELEGQDGNIFAILANASMTLSKAGQREQIDEMFQRVQSCDDYNKALGIISEYVDTELSVPQQSRANHSQTKARDQHER